MAVNDNSTIAVDANNKNNAKTTKKSALEKDTILKIALWILLVTVITAAPIMMRLSFYSLAKGMTDKTKYTAPTTHTISFFTSIWIGTILSFVTGGKKLAYSILNFKSIMLQAPVSVGYSLSEALALYAMRTMDPIMYSVIHKIRLLETALFSKVLLKRHVSFQIWVICFTVTFCVLSFVLFAVHTTAKQDLKDLLFGSLLLLTNITMSVACSIYADWCYKKLPHPYTVQMAQGRITACAGSLALVIIFMAKNNLWQYGYFGGVGGGWDLMTVLFVFFLISRDWLTSWILKNLDALWKALAGSLAVATTYVADIIILKKTMVPTQVCLVFAICFIVTVYALQKQQEKTISDLKKNEAELKLKIEQLAAGHADAWKSTEIAV